MPSRIVDVSDDVSAFISVHDVELRSFGLPESDIQGVSAHIAFILWRGIPNGMLKSPAQYVSVDPDRTGWSIYDVSDGTILFRYTCCGDRVVVLSMSFDWPALIDEIILAQSSTIAA